MTPHILRLRLARQCDVVALQLYFRQLSKVSRYSRFLGTVGEVPADTIRRNIGWMEGDLFSVVALGGTPEMPRIVGEAVCAVAPRAEVALSVEDASQGTGIGQALLATVEMQAIKRGARDLYGHSWSTNHAMRKLASTLGYAIDRAAGDWNCYVIRKSLLVTASVSSRRTVAAAALS